jgi:tetratricopeptide (TPR) repeat protein
MSCDTCTQDNKVPCLAPEHMADNACCICFDTSLPLIEPGCACDKSSCLSHVKCRARVAREEATKGCYTLWWQCDKCKQNFTGLMCRELTRIWCLEVQSRPEDDMERLAALHNKAIDLNSQGFYTLAVELQRTVLATRETVLGSQHVETLAAKGLLGSLLSDEGKPHEGEEILRVVLDEQRIVRGVSLEDTMTTMSNLAMCLSAQGKHKDAEEMRRDLLEEQRIVFDEHHPNVLQTKCDLVISLNQQKKYQEAENMGREVLEHLQQTMGPEHPRTLACMSNLASTLTGQKKYDEAEQMTLQVYEVRVRVLRKDHPDTLLTTEKLAIILCDKGNYAEAEKIARNVLDALKRELGRRQSSARSLMYGGRCSGQSMQTRWKVRAIWPCPLCIKVIMQKHKSF